jgi:hypothetical protein
MLPNFDKYIHQLFKDNKKIVTEAVKLPKPATGTTAPKLDARNSPRDAGGRSAAGILRPYYYDAPEQIKKGTKKKFASGLTGKINALSQATSGKGSISDTIDVLRTPRTKWVQQAGKEVWVDRALLTAFKLHQPDVKQPNMFQGSEDGIYYHLNPQSLKVHAYDSESKAWEPADDEATGNVKNAYQFIKKPQQMDLSIGMPPASGAPTAAP